MSAATLPAELPSVLADGAELLRAVAREPAREAELVAAFRARYAAFRSTLLVDRPPGSPRAERDLHLVHDQIGGLSLAWREQQGAPWALLYADHWAAQYVLSVDERPVTIRQALQAIRLNAHEGGDVLRTLVDDELIAHAVAALDPETTRDDAIAEVDHLRRRFGLQQRERLVAWLEESGLTEDALVAIGRERARRRRWADALTEGRVAARFAQAPAEFDRVTLVAVEGPTTATQEIAERLGGGAPLGTVIERLPAGVSATVRHAFAFECTLDATDATGRRACIALDRRVAELDAETEAAVRKRLVREWLDERRATACIRWYWP